MANCGRLRNSWFRARTWGIGRPFNFVLAASQERKGSRRGKCYQTLGSRPFWNLAKQAYFDRYAWELLPGTARGEDGKRVSGQVQSYDTLPGQQLTDDAIAMY